MRVTVDLSIQESNAIAGFCRQNGRALKERAEREIHSSQATRAVLLADADRWNVIALRFAVEGF